MWHYALPILSHPALNYTKASNSNYIVLSLLSILLKGYRPTTLRTLKSLKAFLQ